MTHKHRHQFGFTFIEVVIAMLVMGILAGVAAPSYRSALNNFRAQSAGHRLVADLHYARSEAQRTSQSRTVQLESANDRYTLVGVADPNHPANSYLVELQDDPFWATFVSVTFGGDESVVFDMHGRPDSDGSVVIRSGDAQRTVLLALDGTASLQ